MKRLLIVVAISVLPLSFAAGLLAGSAHAEPIDHWYDAKVICNHPAEDTMAHLRLEVYQPNGQHPTLLYHCMRHGY
jgi:hypothetical protein